MKNITKKYPMLGSSVDPQKLSLTVKSMGLMLVPLIVAIAKGFDLEIAENDLVMIVTNISSIISIIGVTYGAGRKIYINNKK